MSVDEFIIADEWVGLESMLLAHAHSIIAITFLIFGWYSTSIEGLEDYKDNEPNTDSSEDPFNDEEDDAIV